MRLSIVIFVLSLIGTCSLSAQSDTTSMFVLIDSINIISVPESGKRLAHSPSQSNNGETLINTIDQQSLMTIRSGGPGMISTVLRRGMASRHLGILWEGFNIQSSVNGTFDLGLLPKSFNKVSFLSHDVNPMVGNASTAGAIVIDNQIGKESTKIGLSYGSDHNMRFSAENQLAKNAYAHHLSVDYRLDENQYQFYNGNQKRKQEAASYQVLNAAYKSKFKVSDRFHFNGGVWLQEADRDIPPSKTSVNTKQTQKDKNLRFFLSANYFVNDRSKVVLRSAYFNERLDYDAPGIVSRADTDVYNLGLDYVSTSGLTVRGQMRMDGVEASFFTSSKKRTVYSLMADYRSSWKGYKYAFSIRPQIVDTDFVPLTYNASLSRRISDKVDLNLNVGRGYTVPSFNDLHWPAGGNINLLPEKSNSLEIGVDYKKEKSNGPSLGVNIYHIVIDNWIQWIPISGIFQPVNQRKVRNVGLDVTAHKLWKLYNGILKTDIQYAFVDSRLAKHYYNESLEGNKTIFVPRHKVTTSASYLYKDWTFIVSPLYYSKRYDTVDNSQSVDGYVVMDAQLNKIFRLGNRWLINSSISMENATNSNYENIRFFPMPLRLYRLGFQIHLN